jgi:hypothetical protein
MKATRHQIESLQGTVSIRADVAIFINAQPSTAMPHATPRTPHVLWMREMSVAVEEDKVVVVVVYL